MDLYNWDYWWLLDIWHSNEHVESTVRLGTLMYVWRMRVLADYLAVEE